MSSYKYNYPRNIICLTEESVETLFGIGAKDLVSGVSSFVKRPIEATKLPKISLFTSSKVDEIVSMQPDLVIGFSDIQKDIARDLIGHGLNVLITNQRSIVEILEYMFNLGNLVGKSEEVSSWINKIIQRIDEVSELSNNFVRKPKIYFEEWDDPKISAIQWVSEVVELCGGVDINSHLSKGKLAKERFVSDEEIISANPDIIIGCWCGKKVRIDKIKERTGWQSINAVKNNQVFEVEPEIFLQPGPAALTDGVEQMFKIIKDWQEFTLS